MRFPGERSIAFLALAAALVAQQPPTRLSRTLQKLNDPGQTQASLTQQLTDDIMSLANKDHQPSLGAVSGFTSQLVAALIHRDLTTLQLQGLEQSITEILQPTGSTARSATRLRDILRGKSVEHPEVVTKRFIEVAEEVRGPDDSPAAPQPFRK
jgi:hypothetical protein